MSLLFPDFEGGTGFRFKWFGEKERDHPRKPTYWRGNLYYPTL